MTEQPTVGAGDTAMTPSDEGVAGQNPRFRPNRRHLLVALPAMLVLVTLAIVKIYVPQIEHDAYTSLEIAARLKSQQVEAWLAERHNDGRVLASDTELIERVAAIQHRHDPAMKELILKRLMIVSSGYGYSTAVVLDPTGKELLTAGGAHEISEQTRALLPKAFATDEIARSAFYLDANDGQAALNFVVPLQHIVAGKRQAVGALVLHAEPGESMFPMILGWPSASRSGETLLVKGVGDSVIYLNQLRHTSAPAMTIRQNRADPTLPSATAVRTGKAGASRGKDYRGVDVLAVYRPIAGTNWHLIAKTDYDEIMEPLWRLVIWVGLVALAAALAIGLMLRRLWSQQQSMRELAAQAKLTESLRQREERFRAITETAYDAIVTADTGGNITSWNASAARIFGFDKAEIIGQPLTRIIPPRFQQAAMAGFQRLMNGDPDHLDGGVVELTGQRRDGSEFLLERSVALWQTEDGLFFTCTMRDITERKKADEALRIAAAAFESHEGMVVTDADDVILRINQAFTTITGYPEAEAVGRRMNFLKSDRHEPDFYAEMWQEILAHETWQGEIWNRNRDGTIHPHWLTISAVRDGDGRITHYVGAYTDITERKEALQALEASRNFNEQIVSASPIGILTYDATGQCLTANANAADQLGATREQLLGQDFRKIESWKSSGLLACAEKALATDEHAQIEAHFVTSFGKEIWQHAIFSRFSANGRMNLLLMITDISRRKQQEEKTRQLLAQNETILGNALVGIVYLKQRRIVSCNRRIEELFQYEPGELLGQSSELFYDSHETYEHLGRIAYDAVAEGQNYSTEVMLRHKDGSLFWGALSGRAIDPAHPNDGSIWVYADISERRRAEEETGKLRQAVEQSQVSIVITNRYGVIEYVNPSFTRITGYTREETVGRTPSIVKSAETPRAIHEDLWNTILAGRIWRGILRNRCKNGSLIWEETSISPIFNEDGEISHFVAVKEDVTERKRIERQLEEHQANLEGLVLQRTAELNEALAAAKRADQSKDEFLANITHELRTPLSAVIGFSNLARPFATDARQREYLDKVNSAGKTLAGIIDDLLDLSKIVAGRMEFEVKPFSLRQLVVRSHSVTSYRAQEKGLALIEQIDPEVPDVLVGDSLRVEQILLNLLSNAVKFTTIGRVELRIGIHDREAKRLCLNIEVEDTGIGMSEEGIALLFKPFSQTDASMTRKYGGTGLGLAICKRLAEMMDGDIGVTSREGSGTTFRVRLWLGLDETGALPIETEQPEESTQIRYRDVRVLVVDDQPFNRDVVEGLLAAVGVTPHLADNGQEALDMLSLGTDSFDLVLMDIQMPVMDGLTATRVIRKLEGFAQLPIIAMTAHTMAHEKEKSADAGMNDHIGKPFDESGFYQMLAKWIPRHKHYLPAVAEPRPASTNGMPLLAGVDTRAGLALLLGDETRYRHWLGDFVAEAPAAMKQIRLALAAGTPEAASMTAHTLKGRMGLLGMKTLHAVASALETAIDNASPASELLLDLERGVAAMCAEIQQGLGPVTPPETAAEALPGELPPGTPPASVTRLIERLQAGDSDCDLLVRDCLAELKDTAWVPCLHHVLIHIQNFDFDAAIALLSGKRQARNKGG
ncbi:MAG: PAS domain S-box protein [Sulfuritalea sp.]|nr:PAS domain S-box protein [Sulfuritalea sp.]